MRPAENKGDLIIIGGGASGLAAACIAMQRGKRVLLLEARDRVGKKLLATGNGRCNLMNMGAPVYFGHPRFALEVLRHCPREEVLRFFDALGLTTVAEGDLLYPASMQAAAVLEAEEQPEAAVRVLRRLIDSGLPGAAEAQALAERIQGDARWRWQPGRRTERSGEQWP